MRAILISLVLLAACSPAQAPPSDPPAPSIAAAAPTNAAEATAQDTCGASRFQALIGTQASAIDQSTLPAGSRVITPDMMVTQDFRADRLNVTVGTDGLVASLNCY
jgi:hypothetical protein